MSNLKPGIDYIGVSIVFICHDGSGRFLLLKRSKNSRDEQGTWEFGGGKLEFGKNLEEDVLREVAEEYGCDGKIEEQLPALSLLREHEGARTHWVITPFVVKVDPKEVKLNEPHKHDEIGWFSLDDLPKPLHSGVQSYIGKFRKLLQKYVV
jgi:8-oxo-dGTP pyrophosphatase MutT (NUDIX family)